MVSDLNKFLELSAEEVVALKAENVIIDDSDSDKWIVSAGILAYSQGGRSRKCQRQHTSARIRIHSQRLAAQSLCLPKEPDSAAALELIGYAPQMATQIFQRWEARNDPQQCPDGVFEYAIGNLSMLLSPRVKGLPPADALARLGISDGLIQALLDPWFSQLFHSRTLRFWLHDTIKIRFDTLIMLLQRLKRLGENAVARGRGEAVLAAQYNNLSEEALMLKAESVNDYHQVSDGYVTMYKSVASCNEAILIQKDGSMNFRALTIDRGGDFNATEEACYFSPEPATAEQYRAWIETRCPLTETWLLQIELSVQYMSSFRKTHIFYSPEWKEYLWHCRMGRRVFDQGGEALSKFSKTFQSGRPELIEGHILARDPSLLPRIEDKDIQDGISEEHCLRIAGRKARQVCFLGEQGMEMLENAARGRIHIEIYPATAMST